MSPSTAPRYGAAVERQVAAAKNYDLSDTDRPWYDAVAPDNSPVEIKGAMIERANGSEGRFRLFRKPTEKLRRADGIVTFAAYRVRQSAVEIEAIEAKRARAMRRIQWTSSGHETSGRDQQVKIPISEVF